MKTKILILLLLCAGSISLTGQTKDISIDEWIKERPLRAGVNTNPYEFPDIYDTPAPKGYNPFYISHYGRHGSRSDWGDKEYSEVIRVLSEAKKDRLLTVEGDTLLAVAKRVLAGYDGMDGRLTARGAREHQMLAERMYRRYSKVFDKKGAEIRAFSSYVPRCLISMGAFTAGLAAVKPDFSISWDAGDRFQKYLSNDCPKSVKLASEALLDSLLASRVPDTTFFMKKIFTDPDRVSPMIPDKVKFQRRIFNTAKITGSFDIETDVFNVLPLDVILYWHQYYAAVLYLRRCNSVEYGDQTIAEARPLLKDILDKADEVIKGGSVSADLRFGHDYPVLSLSSLMGFEGVGEKMTYKEIGKRWFGAAYTCFAANIQLVFYKNKGGEVIVKFLLNEKETLLIGQKPYQGPYYLWEDVREVLSSRL